MLWSTTDLVTPPLHLRNATVEDAPLLRAWDEKEHLHGTWWGHSDDDGEWDYEEELTREALLPWTSYQLIAEVDEKPIGIMHIIDPREEETHYWGMDCPPNLRATDIWIGEEEYMGRGFGAKMMEQALHSYCFSDPSVEAVVSDPMWNNFKAHRFYQKCGFRPTGIRSFGLDECLVHKLTREDWEKMQPVLLL